MHALYIHRNPDRPHLVSEGIIADRRLSWEARGVLIYLLTRDATLVEVEDLVRASPAGDGEIGRILTELVSAGYLRRIGKGHDVFVYATTPACHEEQYATLARPPAEPEEAESEPETRFVYLVHDGAGAYKIGLTKDLAKRIWGQIQPAYPRKLELIHAIETDHAEALEAYWHGRFADKRMNGEWFALTEEDIECFKKGLVK